MEDPELNKTPEGWSSQQKFLNMQGKSTGPPLLIIGFIIIILANLFSTEDDKPAYILAGIIFLIVGLGFIIPIVYSNYDKKETWYMFLPYNKRLFERLHPEMESMLKEKKYDFTSGELHGIDTAEDRETGRRYDRIFRINLNDKPGIKITLALVIIHSKYSGISYNFPIELKNIRSENLEEAWQLSWIIKDAMESVKYDQFDEVH